MPGTSLWLEESTQAGPAGLQWEHRPSPCSSLTFPTPVRGCHTLYPHTCTGYYGYFYRCFLKSHFSGCSVCAEKHWSPGNSLPQGHLLLQPAPARSQGGQHFARRLGTERGPLLRGREGKKSVPPRGAVESSCAPWKGAAALPGAALAARGAKG